MGVYNLSTEENYNLYTYFLDEFIDHILYVEPYFLETFLDIAMEDGDLFFFWIVGDKLTGYSEYNLYKIGK